MTGQPADLANLERPILELESQIHALAMDPGKAKEMEKLRKKVDKLRGETFANLTDWQRTQLARHPRRPYTLDYIERICERFEEVHGDRCFGDDAAIVCGMGWIGAKPLMIIGQQKGRDTKQKIQRNFGMAKPEGYRKALRFMKLAEKFNRPILCLIDTPGAYPGVDAEERGQAEAIARSIDVCLGIGVPNVAVIIGEGGSGGAIAIASCNKVLMLEHAIYTVASPEASASILWRESGRAEDAATNMKITAQDLLRFGIIDTIIPEPAGGAHRDRDQIFSVMGDAVEAALADLAGLSREAVKKARSEKFLAMGRKT
jgi:acetyl-CoA carboxylase carboxyl transferase subunit alpha